ncbi:hypothetical protein MRB53_042307 [Persea americana]|nr:hypothetical protein MRB53_042307 [Persea americana]
MVCKLDYLDVIHLKRYDPYWRTVSNKDPVWQCEGRCRDIRPDARLYYRSRGFDGATARQKPDSGRPQYNAGRKLKQPRVLELKVKLYCKQGELGEAKPARTLWQEAIDREQPNRMRAVCLDPATGQEAYRDPQLLAPRPATQRSVRKRDRDADARQAANELNAARRRAKRAKAKAASTVGGTSDTAEAARRTEAAASTTGHLLCGTLFTDEIHNSVNAMIAAFQERQSALEAIQPPVIIEEGQSSSVFDDLNPDDWDTTKWPAETATKAMTIST